jgi:hypothetical protein
MVKNSTKVLEEDPTDQIPTTLLKFGSLIKVDIRQPWNRYHAPNVVKHLLIPAINNDT